MVKKHDIAFNGVDLVELYKLKENVCYSTSELKSYNKYYFESKINQGFIKNKTKLKKYRFYFKNIKNMEIFKENIKKYLPKYGGFSSYVFAKEKIENIFSEDLKVNTVFKYKINKDSEKNLYFFKNEENMNNFFGGAKYVKVNSPQQAYISLHSSLDIDKVLENAQEILDSTPKNSEFYNSKKINFENTKKLYDEVNQKCFCNLDKGEDYIKSHYIKIADQKWINLWGDICQGALNNDLF